MKIESKLLKKLLNYCKRVVDRKSTMPILSSVRLEASDGKLTIAATDLNSWLHLTAPCQGSLATVQVELATLLTVTDAKKAPTVNLAVTYSDDTDQPACETEHPIEGAAVRCHKHAGHDGEHEAYSSITHDDVTWTGPAKQQAPLPKVPTLCVAVGARRFQLAVPYRDKDWPKSSALVEHKGTSLHVTYDDPTQLASALAYVLPAVSTDESRPILNGALLSGMTLTGTDGHRLHRAGVSNTPAISDKYQRIFSRNGAFALPPMLADATKGSKISLEIFEDKSAIRWIVQLDDGATAELWCHPIEAQFPSYEQVIPALDSLTVTAEGKVAALREAFTFAAKMAPNKSGGVECVLGDGKLAISTDDLDRGVVVEEVPLLRSEGTSTFGVSARYVIDALAIDAHTITMANDGDALSPLRFDSPDGSRLAVVMPTRI